MNSNFLTLTNMFHSKLDATIETLESRYKEELRKRDNLIENLSEKLIRIEKEREDERNELAQLRELVEKPVTSRNSDNKSMYEYVHDHAHVVPEWNEKADLDDVIGKGEKERVDLCIFGDSCVKHLNVDRILPGRNNELICKRGGKINDIRDEILKYNASHDIAHCVVHVGSNHVPEEPPHIVTPKLLALLKELRQNMPETCIHMSAILPKYDLENDISFSPGIDLINWWVRQYSNKIGFTFIDHPEFNVPTNKHFICKDGVHPSFKGVAQMAMDIKY